LLCDAAAAQQSNARMRTRRLRVRQDQGRARRPSTLPPPLPSSSPSPTFSPVFVPHRSYVFFTSRPLGRGRGVPPRPSSNYFSIQLRKCT
jgi:hypothetical protein